MHAVTSIMLHKNAVVYRKQVDEALLMEHFAARISAFSQLYQASPAIKKHMLYELQSVAQSFNGTLEVGSSSGYVRRLLFEVPDHWSLAAIVLRPGQTIHPHDHSGWGCAVTVRGIERDRRFIQNTSGNLALSSERDYPPGTGYFFDASDIHQPVGADPHQVTVALHFLVTERRFP